MIVNINYKYVYVQLKDNVYMYKLSDTNMVIKTQSNIIILERRWIISSLSDNISR